MAARRHVVVPGIGLAALHMLARDPPAADLFGPGRILQVQDLDDVADIAGRGRRNIGVAPVKIIAVHAAALRARLPVGDQARPLGTADVVDAQAAAEIVGAAAEFLVIDDHQAVLRPDLVRMPAYRHLQRGQQPRLARIGDVIDGGAIRRAHMGDIHRRPLDPDLPAPLAIDVSQQRGVPLFSQDPTPSDQLDQVALGRA